MLGKFKLMLSRFTSFGAKAKLFIPQDFTTIFVTCIAFLFLIGMFCFFYFVGLNSSVQAPGANQLAVVNTALAAEVVKPREWAVDCKSLPGPGICQCMKVKPSQVLGDITSDEIRRVISEWFYMQGKAPIPAVYVLIGKAHLLRNEALMEVCCRLPVEEIIKTPAFLLPSLPFRFSSIVLLLIIANCLALVINCLVTAGVFTVLERKFLAIIQRRVGPTQARPAGLSQFLADGGKLLPKQLLLPRHAQKFVFLFGPICLLTFALTQWGLLPLNFFSSYTNDLAFGLLLSLMLSSLSVLAMIGASWAANSKYPFLASLRSVSLLISYELIFSFIALTLASLTGSLSFVQILSFQHFYRLAFAALLLPLFICFLIVALMETNRAPYDIAEAESELGAGYNTEHSSLVFALFFLAEYLNMALMCVVGGVLFFGVSFFSFRGISLIVVLMLGFVLVRGIVPRYRFDRIMQIGWKQLLPLVMGFFVFVLGLVIYTSLGVSGAELPYLGQQLQKFYFIYKPIEESLLFASETAEVGSNSVELAANLDSSAVIYCQFYDRLVSLAHLDSSTTEPEFFHF